MTASLETLVIAAYVFADALPIPRSGPPGKTTDQELIALAVAQAIIGIPPIASSWGSLRLVLLCDAKGVPVGYDLVGPKTGQERECTLDLAAGQAGALLFADGGFWGREYLSSMELIDVELITPGKHRLGNRPSGEIAKARIRLVIESVFSNLKRQMRLEAHLAKTLGGLCCPNRPCPRAARSRRAATRRSHNLSVEGSSPFRPIKETCHSLKWARSSSSGSLVTSSCSFGSVRAWTVTAG